MILALHGTLNNLFAPSAGRTAGLKAGRLAGLWGKNIAPISGPDKGLATMELQDRVVAAVP